MDCRDDQSNRKEKKESRRKKQQNVGRAETGAHYDFVVLSMGREG